MSEWSKKYDENFTTIKNASLHCTKYEILKNEKLQQQQQQQKRNRWCISCVHEKCIFKEF